MCSIEEDYSLLCPSFYWMPHDSQLAFVHSHNFFSTNDFAFSEPPWLHALSDRPSGCSSTPFSSRLQARSGFKSSHPPPPCFSSPGLQPAMNTCYQRWSFAIVPKRNIAKICCWRQQQCSQLTIKNITGICSNIKPQVHNCRSDGSQQISAIC